MLVPPLELSGKENIQKHQLAKLQTTLKHVTARSPFYKRHFRGHNIANIAALGDLQQLPTTSKHHLQQYQQDFWCVGPKEIVEYCSTSGTEGSPVIVPLTEQDMERLAYNEAISFACAGCGPDDIFQLTTTIDRQFMAGLAYSLGARRLGAGMVRVGPGLPQLQWKTIFDVRPTTLIIVPSFLTKLIAYAEANGIDFKNSTVSKAICIGEPIRNADFTLNALGRKIYDKWPVDMVSTYASTEMATAFTECGQGIGGHLHPELIIAEVLDENERPVAPGTPGELTITTLGMAAMPLVRFKTGDICSLHVESCGCGRNTSRVGPIIGRKHQLIKYKGTSCYPPAIFDLLDRDDDIINYQVEVSADALGNDELIVRYSSIKENKKANLIEVFKSALRVTPKLIELDDEKLQPLIFIKTSRKPVKFLNKRKQG